MNSRQAATKAQIFPHLFIGGEWVAPSAGRRISSINPAQGKVWAEVAEADEQDISQAVAAAKHAFEGAWSKKSPSERGLLLRRLAELISENIERIATLDTKDNGKHIRESTAEVTNVVQWVHYFAGLADKIEGTYLPIAGQSEFGYTIREPLGVVGAIVPWNSPTFVALGKLCPALAAGNTVVFKPAEGTPTGALALAELFEKAGFPPGTVNVVPGFGPTAGAALAKHPDVDKISFTGEHLTAQAITHDSAPSLKNLQYECGGKSPQIIFADADLSNALSAATTGIFVNSGQQCSVGSRLFLQDEIYETFLEKLVAVAKRIRVGDPFDPNIHMGAVSSQEQLDKIERYVSIGLKEGGRIVCGGSRPSVPDLAGGYFYQPTVFVDVENSMQVCQDEIFGPVVTVFKFKDEEDLLEMANDSKYGLVAGIWTNNLGRAHRLARNLEAGLVWINTYRRHHWTLPYGGMKLSGHGRENGLETIHEFTRVKSVLVDTDPNRPEPYPA
jgi:aldehyde dehydrogenase (NAD+)